VLHVPYFINHVFSSLREKYHAQPGSIRDYHNDRFSCKHPLSDLPQSPGSCYRCPRVGIAHLPRKISPVQL